MNSLYRKLEISQKETSVSESEGRYLATLIKRHRFSKTLEVGLAYGCSAAFIIDATQSKHVAIDPYQGDFRQLGIKNLKKLGYKKYLKLITDHSEHALPKLAISGQTFDFIFIDGSHKFDQVFIDWYYSDLLLKPGGLIVFDDTWMRSIQVVAAFIQKNRKDYRKVRSKERNFAIFQKTNRKDKRTWKDFTEFYSSPR